MVRRRGAPRILVIGTGSAGRRHALLLTEMGADVEAMDPDDKRASAIPETTPVPFVLDRLDHYDGIVVASPSICHDEQARLALTGSDRVLVEKPLAMSGAAATELARLGGNRLMVGYNLRLHEPVERLMSVVCSGQVGTPLAIRVWFGSYLPDWRPLSDYRTTYSAQAKLGGGVLFDAIHELDLLLWLLDDQLTVTSAVVDRVGQLEIDVEDTVLAVLRHESGAIAEISLDYLSRRYRRGIEVVGTEATARLDWSRQVLEVENRDGVGVSPATTPIDVSYRRQTRRFLDWIEGTALPPVDGAAGAASVVLAERIKDAAQ